MTRFHALLALALAGCTAKDTDTDADSTDPAVIGAARSCDVTLTRALPAGVKKLQVAGRFNDWLPTDLTDEDGDGTYELWLGKLLPGTYGHKFVLDGTWEEPPVDVYTTWEDGFENRALVVKDCDQPSLRFLSGEATPDGTLTAELEFLRAADGAPLDKDSVVATVGGVPVEPEIDGGTLRIDVTGLSPGKHTVRVELADEDGLTPEDGAAVLPLWVEETPFDWADGMLYYVFLDRFRDGGDDGLGPVGDGAIFGTDYAGGDLVGAKEAIEEGYFEALGVRTLWLSPVYQNPDSAFGGSFGYQYTGYHGYWPVKGREVEDRLGTTDLAADQALRDLVTAAHARGIRVILDTVLNHVHEEHEYIVEHPEWFEAAPCPCSSDNGPCGWDSNPIGCWFTDYLPDLDYKNQEIVDQLVDDLSYWLEEYDIDGFRVDAAKHMDHVILRSSSMQLRDRYEAPGGPELWLVGETFVGAGAQGTIMNYVGETELDGQFDFTLLYPVRNAIGKTGGFWPLANEVRASDAAYGPWVHRMSVFFGNHDVDRYSTYISGCPGYDPYNTLFDWCPDPLEGGTDVSGAQWDVINRLATSYAFVVTQPGPPLLYYGDEIGLAGAGDPDNRRLMPWGELSPARQTLFDRMAQLGQVRRDVDALHYGARQELWVDDSLYVYARDAGGGNVAIVVLYTGSGPRTQSVPIPSELGLSGKTLQNAAALGNDQSYSVGDTLEITVDPWEYLVLHGG